MMLLLLWQMARLCVCSSVSLRDCLFFCIFLCQSSPTCKFLDVVQPQEPSIGFVFVLKDLSRTAVRLP